jgi:hypothetical protein
MEEQLLDYSEEADLAVSSSFQNGLADDSPAASPDTGAVGGSAQSSAGKGYSSGAATGSAGADSGTPGTASSGRPEEGSGGSKRQARKKNKRGGGYDGGDRRFDENGGDSAPHKRVVTVEKAGHASFSHHHSVGASYPYQARRIVVEPAPRQQQPPGPVFVVERTADRVTVPAAVAPASVVSVEPTPHLILTNLVRPLKPAQLEQLLASHGPLLPGGDGFFINFLKTTAYASYAGSADNTTEPVRGSQLEAEAIKAATHAKNALHKASWKGQNLVVDYCTLPARSAPAYEDQLAAAAGGRRTTSAQLRDQAQAQASAARSAGSGSAPSMGTQDTELSQSSGERLCLTN